VAWLRFGDFYFRWIARIYEERMEDRPPNALSYPYKGAGEPVIGCMKMRDYTGLLFAQPSFAEGLARTLDIGGTFDAYNESQTSEEADRLAIASDWYAVGADLLSAINRYASKVGYEVRNVSRSQTR
jgi:hypothetical protein